MIQGRLINIGWTPMVGGNLTVFATIKTHSGKKAVVTLGQVSGKKGLEEAISQANEQWPNPGKRRVVGGTQ